MICIFPFNNLWSRYSIEFIDENLVKYETDFLKEKNSRKIGHVEKVLNISFGDEHISVQLHALQTSKLDSEAYLCLEDVDNRQNHPMILIHGGAGSSLTFVNIMEPLSKVFNVYALDLPGFGRSHFNSSFRSIKKLYENPADIYCDIIKEFMDLLKIKTVILCGHSFGGYISIRFCKIYRSRVSGLVLMNPAGVFPTLGSLGMYWACVFKFSVPNIGRYLGRFGYLFMTHLFTSSTETMYWYYITSHPRGIGDLFIRDKITLSMFHAYWNAPVFDHFDEIRCPILCIYGAEDTIMPSHQGMVVNQIFDAHLKTIQNAGHNPMDTKENGQLVSDKIIEFLEHKKYNYDGEEMFVGKKKEPLEPAMYKSSFFVRKTIDTIDRLYLDIAKNEGKNIDVNVEIKNCISSAHNVAPT